MIAVVAGILMQNGKVMLCQRRPTGSEPLKWEFPGGKLERGESPEQALERELREELSIVTCTGRIYDAHRTASEDGSDLMILFYRTRLLSGLPTALECNAVAWVAPDRLTHFDLAAADALVAARLAQELTFEA